MLNSPQLAHPGWMLNVTGSTGYLRVGFEVLRVRFTLTLWSMVLKICPRSKHEAPRSEPVVRRSQHVVHV